MKGISGFLLLEATSAILISIMLSFSMVWYQGKAATARAQAHRRLERLTRARDSLERVLAGEDPQESCSYIPIGRPQIQGLPLMIPELQPILMVSVIDEQEERLTLTRWVGADQ
jgi:hypothetical protein